MQKQRSRPLGIRREREPRQMDGSATYQARTLLPAPYTSITKRIAFQFRDLNFSLGYRRIMMCLSCDADCRNASAATEREAFFFDGFLPQHPGRPGATAVKKNILLLPITYAH